MATHDGQKRKRSAATPSVAIVGAGMGGISASVLLKQAGFDTFTVYETSERAGGTWWDNRYPGAEVDVVSYVYSFPFKRHDWTRTHARQPEIHAYLEQTCRDFGLEPHIRFGVGVESAVWNHDRHGYELTLTDGERSYCDVLVSAVGFLNVPYVPDIPGLSSFRGPCFHTARWETEHDLRGKRVAVVGTGSTASQLIPELQPIVDRLYVFQRDPGWVLPKADREFTADERRDLSRPWKHHARRLKWYWETEKRLYDAATYRPGSPLNTQMEQLARTYIDDTFKDRPDLAEALTPTYPFWGKRTIFSSTFYPSLLQPNVELVPRAVASATPTGVVDRDGVHHEVDVIVLATGFRATDYLARLRVVGRTGRSIHEYWNGEPRAFLGVTVPEFPNFFLLYGPGTNGGEIALNLRNQAAHARRAIRRIMRSGARTIEVKRSWADPYHAWLMSKMDGTAWSVSSNYFTTASGKIVTQWPFGPIGYGALLKLLGRVSETTQDLGGASASDRRTTQGTP